MHDPSGCNSTYNTHDETRWTSMESLIFLSGLTQLDAITGNDQRLIDDIVSSAKEFSPKFIAIANSPVPWLIGTDFTAICSKVSSLTGIPAFHVATNAMHDYTWGAGQAFLMLGKTMFSGKSRSMESSGDSASLQKCKPGKDPQSESGDASGQRQIRRNCRVNILGMTPLDFTDRSETASLRRILEENGFDVVSVWAVCDTLDNLKKSPGADVNLVVSSTGIYAARWMEETFGIPYVAGVPVGAFAPVLIRQLARSASDGTSSVPYLEIIRKSTAQETGAAYENPGKDISPDGVSRKRCAAGEPVTMGSLAADRFLRDGRGCDLIPLTETVSGLIPENAPCPAGEAQIREVLARYDEVTADPMLREACRPGCRFEERPHFALSGRMYLDQIRPLIEA